VFKVSQAGIKTLRISSKEGSTRGMHSIKASAANYWPANCSFCDGHFTATKA
jgi:prepilin-type processing-associated H-X9-DG protein